MRPSGSAVQTNAGSVSTMRLSSLSMSVLSWPSAITTRVLLAWTPVRRGAPTVCGPRPACTIRLALARLGGRMAAPPPHGGWHPALCRPRLAALRTSVHTCMTGCGPPSHYDAPCDARCPLILWYRSGRDRYHRLIASREREEVSSKDPEQSPRALPVCAAHLKVGCHAIPFYRHASKTTLH